VSTVQRGLVYPVPASWQLRTVDEIKAAEPSACVAGPFGSKIASRYFTESGVPVVRGSNLTDDLTRFVADSFVFVSEEKAEEFGPQHVRPGDLVFTCWGTLGQVGLVPTDGPFPEYIISNKQLKLRINRGIADPEFCYYYFASPRYVANLRDRNIGGAVPGINLGILKSLKIALPALAVQREIARTLSAYDDLIDNNRRRIKLLEHSVRLLFDEWFVRRRPSAGAVGGQDYPADWRSVRASEIIDINPTTRRKDNGSLCYVPMAALSTAGTTVDRSQLERREASTSVRFIRGDTLFARITPCLENGKTALAYFLDPGEVACGSTEFIVLRGRAVGPAFTYCLARNEMFRENAIKSMIGSSGRQRVQPSAFDKFELMLAPQHVIVQFEAMAKDCFDQIALLVRQCDRLVEARNLLLPRLMSGELTV